MAAQHTPGPWITGHNVYGHSRLAVMNPRNVIIAEVTDWPNEDTTEANALLIAAAPELLEALEDIVARNEIQHWFNLDKARAAIAKARDES